MKLFSPQNFRKLLENEQAPSADQETSAAPSSVETTKLSDTLNDKITPYNMSEEGAALLKTFINFASENGGFEPQDSHFEILAEGLIALNDIEEVRKIMTFLFNTDETLAEMAMALETSEAFNAAMKAVTDHYRTGSVKHLTDDNDTEIGKPHPGE